MARCWAFSNTAVQKPITNVFPGTIHFAALSLSCRFSKGNIIRTCSYFQLLSADIPSQYNPWCPFPEASNNTKEKIFSLQDILLLWKFMFEVLCCHVSTRLTLSVIAQLLMRAWWVLYTSAGYSAHRREPWCDFLQHLQSFRVASVFIFPLASFYPESEWPLPALQWGGRPLGSCYWTRGIEAWHTSENPAWSLFQAFPRVAHRGIHIMLLPYCKTGVLVQCFLWAAWAFPDILGPLQLVVSSSGESIVWHLTASL